MDNLALQHNFILNIANHNINLKTYLKLATITLTCSEDTLDMNHDVNLYNANTSKILKHAGK